MRRSSIRLGLSLVATIFLLAGCGGSDDKPTPKLETPAGRPEIWIVSVPPDRKVSAVKAVRDVAGLGLADAKALVEGAPKLVKVAGDRAEAEMIAKSLRDAGATVEIR